MQKPGANPYTNEERKMPLIGSGTALITHKPVPLPQLVDIEPQSAALFADQNNNADNKGLGSNRPPSGGSQPRSNSGQNKRIQMNNGGSLHQLIEQSNA